MTIGGSLLAVLPKGFFSWPNAVEKGTRDQDAVPMVLNDEGERKRRREKDVSGSATPTLISPIRRLSSSEVSIDSDDDNCRPRKRLRGRSKLTSVPSLIEAPAAEKAPKKKQTSDLLRIVPEDVVAHCLSFLGTAEDRFALQTTCKTFRDISNSDAMLENVDICGDKETGKNGIIQETDTPSTAAVTLAPFARAGNLDALYM